MKNLCLGAFLAASAAYAIATPSKQVVHSCLRTESIAGNVNYVDIHPDSFSEEEDQDAKITIITLTHRNKKLGLWKTLDEATFGVVFNSKKIPATRIRQLSGHKPIPFTPYTAMYGEARSVGRTYLCITFNFEGLGQSGSFQNIRGLYVIEPGKPTKVFYTEGDIRKIPQER